MDPASQASEDSQETNPPIRLGGKVFHFYRHLCAFFNSREEEYRVLLPFIKDGLQRYKEAVPIIDPRRHNQHVERLSLDVLPQYENLFFVAPDEFLRGLREQRGPGEGAVKNRSRA